MLSTAGPCGPEPAIRPEFNTRRDPELVDETRELKRVVTEAQAADWEPWGERGAFGLRADGGRRRPDQDNDDSGFGDFDDDSGFDDFDGDDRGDDLDDDVLGHDDLEEDSDEFDDHEEL